MEASGEPKLRVTEVLLTSLGGLEERTAGAGVSGVSHSGSLVLCMKAGESCKAVEGPKV